MKFSTGVTARRIRRREIIVELQGVIDTLVANQRPKNVANALETIQVTQELNEPAKIARILLIELAELCAIAEQPKPRRKH